MTNAAVHNQIEMPQNQNEAMDYMLYKIASRVFNSLVNEQNFIVKVAEAAAKLKSDDPFLELGEYVSIETACEICNIKVISYFYDTYVARGIIKDYGSSVGQKNKALFKTSDLRRAIEDGKIKIKGSKKRI